MTEEKASWHDIYRYPDLIKRRKNKHVQRLKALGLFDISKDSSIIELCCGNGENLEILKNMGMKDLTGVDLKIFPATLESNPGIKFIECDARKVPVESAKYDWVLCIHSLHHLGGAAEAQELIAEVMRLLKKGGRFALIDHYSSKWLYLAFWLIRRQFSVFPGWLKVFGKQLEEEKSYLYRYLSEWRAINKVLRGSGLKKLLFKRKLFFFYFIGEKAGS
jgi:ubiquinone/menaquinone biosynthesis C-methylase UbiE